MKLFKGRPVVSIAAVTFLVVSASIFSQVASAQLTYLPGPSFNQTFNVAQKTIQFTPVTRHQMFRQSDTITISTTGSTTITVMGLDGTVLYTGAPKSFTLPVGHYFVQTAGDRAEFVVLPNDYAGGSTLGIDADPGTSTFYTEQLAQIQPGWARIHVEGQWATVQPQANVWNWGPMDAAVAANAGRKMIVTAFIRPSWQTDNSQFIPLYTEYVRRMAQRYAGQLYAIEIWNEPYDTGTAASALPTPWVDFYADMVKSAAPAIRTAAPNIKVSGCGFVNFSSYVPWFQSLVDLGAIDQLDAVTYHDYDTDRYTPDQDMTVTPRLDHKIQTLRSIIGPSKPIWISEAAFFGQSAIGAPNPVAPAPGASNPAINWRRGLARAIKYCVMYPAASVELVMGHVMGLASYGDPNTSNIEFYGMEYADRGPHPKTSAVLMSSYWLKGATFVDMRSLANRVFLYAWQRADGTAVVFAWTVEGDSVALTANNGLTATDIFGSSLTVSTLGEIPVLFRSSTTGAATLMQNVMNALATTLNLPPVLGAISNQSVQKDQLLQFSVSATDPDSDPITYSASPLPTGATINSTTGVFSWTPTAAQVSSYSITFTATDARGMSTSQVTTIDVLGNPLDGLVSRWKFDEGTGTTTGDSGGTNPGTLVNFNFNTSSGWVAGQQGNALKFDGINDYVGLDTSKLNCTNNFTIVAWIYPQAATGNTPYISVRSGPDSGLRFFISGNRLLLIGVSATDWRYADFAGGQIQNNTWYHIAVVYDKGTMKAYINGVYQGGVVWNENLVMKSNWSSKLGAEGTQYFKGVLDDVMIFNRTLSGAEVLSFYQGGTSTNQAPVLAALGNKSVNEGAALSFTISGSDADSTNLTYSASGLPTGASFNTSTRAFSWTPTSSQAGSYSVTFTVSDGSLTDSETITITVANVNQAPVLAAIGNKSVSEGSTLTFTNSATDADGDTLTYSASGLPTGASFNTSTRVFSWVPTSSQAGSYSATFAVSDGSTSDTENITITVANVNQAPVISSIGNKSVSENQALSFTVSASDPDGSALTYSATSLPSGAAFNTSTHAFSWTPSYTQAGSYNATFSVTDGALSASQTITITVANVNRAPTLTAIGNKSVNTSQALSFTIAGSDADGDSLSYSASGLPSGASFSTSSRTFSWTPSSSQAGSYNVTFAVSDGSLSANETITITVGAVNQAPVLAAIGNKSVNENAALSFTVSATDADGQSLTYSATGLPSGASFNTSTRAFAWTPTYSQSGSYSVTFTVSDGSATDSETITITVNNVNQAPAISSIGNKSVSENQLLSFTIAASDADGNTLTYSASGLPSGASFNTSTHAFSWTPSSTQSGNYNVTFTVNDGTVSTSATITISVGNVNQPPVLAGIGNKSVNEAQALSFTLSATDPDGGTLTYSATGLPSGALLNTTTGAFSWSPTYSQAGSYSVTFAVSDGSLTDIEAITITVANVNRAPVLSAIGSRTATVGQTLSFTISGSDPDSDSLIYSASSLPAGATFDSSTRTFSWSPSDSQTGTFNVTFAVADAALSASETVTITVSTASTNTAPTLASVDIAAGVANLSLNDTLTASDPDGDPLTFSASGLPSGATLNSNTGLLTWTPSTTQVGAYNATVSVSDGSQSASTEVPLLVVHPNYDWLAGSKLFAYQMLNSNRVFVYSYRRPDRTSMVVAWCKSGTTATLTATTGLTRTDLYNQAYNSTTLGSQPVLFHSSKRVSPRQALDTVTAAIH